MKKPPLPFDYDLYILQYCNSFDLIINSKNVNNLLYPLIFHITHIAELVLKSLIHQYDGFSEEWTIKGLRANSHDLIQLLIKYQFEFQELKISKKLYNDVLTGIKKIHDVTGFINLNMNSRYPVDIHNKKSPKIKTVNIEKFVLMLNYLLLNIFSLYIDGKKGIVMSMKKISNVLKNTLMELEECKKRFKKETN